MGAPKSEGGARHARASLTYQKMESVDHQPERLEEEARKMTIPEPIKKLTESDHGTYHHSFTSRQPNVLTIMTSSGVTIGQLDENGCELPIRGSIRRFSSVSEAGKYFMSRMKKEKRHADDE